MRKRGKRILSVVVALSLTLGPVPFPGDLGDKVQTVQRAAAATEETLGDFTYTTGSGNQVTITKYEGFDTDLNLPEIFGKENLTVVAIGEAAFYNRTTLSSVTIPKEVTNIGGNAFWKCSGLTKVTFEKDDEGQCSLKTIYGAAFAETGLTEISIPGSVTSLGAAGKSTSGLIPGYGSNDFKGTFYKCANLKSVTFEEGTEPLSLYGNTPGAGGGAGDFNECTSLSTLVFPDRITAIPDYECYKSGVTKVTLPDSVATIGKGAFQRSTVADINFPESLQTIGDWAFGNSSIAGDIVFPDKLTTIGENAFYNTAVTNVTFPAALTSLSGKAFDSCSSLHSATFYGSVMSSGVFSGSASDFTVYAYKDLGSSIRNQCMSDKYFFNYLSKGVTVKEEPTKTKYTYGDSLDTTDLVLTAEALTSNGKTEEIEVQGSDIGACKFDGYDAKKAGPQTVTVSYGKADAAFDVAVRYDLSNSTKTNCEVKSYTYTGEEIVPEVTITYDSKTVPKDCYKVTASNNVNPGTAQYTVTAVDEDYAIETCKGTFTIQQKSLMDEEISVEVAPESLDYTGKECIPDITVTHLSGEKEITLKEGTDYQLSYRSDASGTYGPELPKNAGTVTVKITGKGNYTDSITRTYSIEPLDISSEDSGITVSDIPDQVYSGNVLRPTVTVNHTVDGVTQPLTQGTEYTIEYAHNQAVGTATVTIKGKGNYQGTITKEFTIKPIDLNSNNISIPKLSDRTYTGEEIKPELKVTRGGQELAEGTDYTWQAAGGAVDAAGKITGYGDVTITIEGKGNYGGTVTRTFTVNVSMADVSVKDIQDQTYTGSAIAPKLQVSFADGVLVEGVDYTVFYTNNTNAGNASVTLTGKGLFQGTKTVYFTIEAVDISEGEIDDIPDQTLISGQAVKPAVRVTLDGKTLNSGIDYKLVYEDNDKAGIATVTVTGIGNYTGTLTITFTIKETTNPDGTTTNPDGTTTNPGGTTTNPGGTTTNPGGSTTTQQPQNTQKPSSTDDEEDDDGDEDSSKKQTIQVRVVKKTVKAAQLKKKAVTFSIKASAQGAISCKKVSGDKRLTISKTGTVKVKKGTKKGTYTIKVKITAAKKAGYEKTSVTKTIKVTVA